APAETGWRPGPKSQPLLRRAGGWDRSPRPALGSTRMPENPGPTPQAQFFPRGQTPHPDQPLKRSTAMPKFVIERNIKGVGQMSPEEMRGAAQKSCSVLQKLGPQVQWQQTFVTRDKLYCVYLA